MMQEQAHKLLSKLWAREGSGIDEIYVQYWRTLVLFELSLI